MSISPFINPKEYASPGNVDGVPVSELAPLLGTPIRTLLADKDISAIANLATANRVAGQAVDIVTQDRIEIEAVSSSNVLLGKWQVEMDDWRSLTPADVGDTLSVAGGTAYDAGNMLIGRNNTDRVMLQADGFTTGETGFDINVYGVAQDSGLLARRLSGAGTHHSKPYLAITKADAQPAIPDGTEFTFNGYLLTHTPQDGEPQFYDPNITLPATGSAFYLLVIQLIFNHNTATWTVDVGRLVTEGDYGFTQYRDDSLAYTDPNTVNTDEMWVRYRDENGFWVHTRLRNEEYFSRTVPQGWRPENAAIWGMNAGVATRYEANAHEWSRYTFLEATYVQFDAAGTSVVRRNVIFVPAFRVRATAAGEDVDGYHSVQFYFGVSGSGYHFGAQNLRADATATDQFIRLNMVTLTADNEGRTLNDYIHVRAGYSADKWGFNLRWW